MPQAARSALFATGVVLFVLIMVVNVSAHAILNRSNSSVG
jgi:ABC-type phosphate transport system permease subunit